RSRNMSTVFSQFFSVFLFLSPTLGPKSPALVRAALFVAHEHREAAEFLLAPRPILDRRGAKALAWIRFQIIETCNIATAYLAAAERARPRVKVSNPEVF